MERVELFFGHLISNKPFCCCKVIYDSSGWMGAWLRSHCQSDQERNKRRSNPQLWDASFTQSLPRVSYPDAQQEESELLKIFDAVRSYGIVLLEDVPKTAQATEEIAGLLSFIRETHYGRVFEIISTPEPAVIANAPVPLRPHTDENFREPPPGIKIFHSLRAREDNGGDSLMTDGFKLAADYKTMYPQDYQLLSEVPIPHRRFLGNGGLRAEAPMIQHDYFGQVCEFRLKNPYAERRGLGQPQRGSVYLAVKDG